MPSKANGDNAREEHRQHISPFGTKRQNMKTNRILRTMTLTGLVLAFSVPLLLTGWGAQAEEGIQKMGPDISALQAKAEKGDPDAQCALGIMFAKGGAPKDQAEAVRWYRKAAEQGHAKGQYLLGYILALGRGVRPDSAEALRWVRKSAEQGYSYAELEFGLMCVMGDNNVPKDATEGLARIRKAAEQGNVQAQASLAHFLHTGQGVPKDRAEALKWYRKAAEQAWAPTQCTFAKMFADGDGVPKDLAEARQWYRKAADQGDSQAQLNLGMMFADGMGVPTNTVNAYMWFDLAAARGLRDAVTNRARMESQMTPDEIAEAKRLSAQFVPRKIPPPPDAPW